jgi:hypothetical protein
LVLLVDPVVLDVEDVDEAGDEELCETADDAVVDPVVCCWPVTAGDVADGPPVPLTAAPEGLLVLEAEAGDVTVDFPADKLLGLDAC